MILSTTPRIELLNVDCMEYMATLPDKAFDLAVVDPPYGIDYAKRKHKTVNSKIQYQPKDWDSITPNRSYFDELFRVSNNQIIWGGNYFLEYLGNCRGMICWDKCQPEGLDQAMCEFAWVSFDKSAKIFKTSIQQIQFTRTHPTEKPIKLYKWLITHYALPGNRILDTHLGSGSSAIAAHKMGFDFVGCELDKDYYDGAIKRFKEQTMQQDMFQNNGGNNDTDTGIIKPTQISLL